MHRVESLGNVQLDHKRRSEVAMKTSINIPDIHEVVVDATRLDEGTLAAGDDIIHLRAQTKDHSLGDNLWDHVN
jgi:hypothetical protein